MKDYILYLRHTTSCTLTLSQPKLKLHLISDFLTQVVFCRGCQILPSSALVGKFIWTWAELALLSLFPSSDPSRADPTRPEKYQNSILSKTNLVKLVLQVELTIFGRRPQIFVKWRTTSIFSKWRTNSNFISHNKDNLNFFI